MRERGGACTVYRRSRILKIRRLKPKPSNIRKLLGTARTRRVRELDRLRIEYMGISLIVKDTRLSWLPVAVTERRQRWSFVLCASSRATARDIAKGRVHVFPSFPPLVALPTRSRPKRCPIKFSLTVKRSSTVGLNAEHGRESLFLLLDLPEIGSKSILEISLASVDLTV